MGMSAGWNQIHFNLADFTRRAYGTNYMETVRLQIHANVRIRRIYFTDRLYQENELPNEYRLIQQPKTKKSLIWKIPAARPPSPLSNRIQATNDKQVPTTADDTRSIGGITNTIDDIDLTEIAPSEKGD